MKMNQTDRYLEMLKRISRIINPFLKIRSMPKFASEIKNYRNKYTHLNIEPKDIDLQSLFVFSEKIKLVIIINVLIIAGLSPDFLKKQLSSTTAFTHIKKR